MSYFYIVITVTPLKGSPYPRTFLTKKHPLSRLAEYRKYAMEETPVAKRPYRVDLTFYSEIEYDWQCVPAEKAVDYYEL